MIEIIVPTVGAVIVVLTLYDLAATVVGASRGAGPITGRIARRTWGGLLRIHRRWSHPVMLRRAGPSILLAIIVVWVGLLIVGWGMVFGAGGAVLSPDEDQPLAFLGRVYFAAATIIGRGAVRGRPSGDLWEALEEVAGVTGIALLSLSIAYVIPVVQAVVTKRGTARYISSLGETPREILDNAWNGTDLGDLNLHVIALTPMVAELAERHLAYPIVHYFHSSERATAIGPSIVALDEVLTMNARMVDPGHRIPKSATAPLRRAITQFLETLDADFIQAVDEQIDAAALQHLRESGVPVVDELPEDPSHETSDRRQLLRGYLDHDGWYDSGLLPRAGRATREEEPEAASR